jgi:type I restriction enzyme S subunit
MPQLLNKESGTVFGSVNRNDINGLEVDIPDDVERQRNIARYLTMLDEKIELNNKINNNLAEQSQAILKRYMDSCDYTLMPLGELAEIIDCLHSKKPNSVNNTTKQLLQLNNITDSGFLDLSTKYYISIPVKHLARYHKRQIYATMLV